jgi:hypothetical protein
VGLPDPVTVKMPGSKIPFTVSDPATVIAVESVTVLVDFIVTCRKVVLADPPMVWEVPAKNTLLLALLVAVYVPELDQLPDRVTLYPPWLMVPLLFMVIPPDTVRFLLTVRVVLTEPPIVRLLAVARLLTVG